MSRAQIALEAQYTLTQQRRESADEKSYTAYLLREGLDKIAKKCGEECFEACIAAKNGVKADTVGELNDVFYHVTVLLCFMDIPFSAVMKDLNRRTDSTGADVDTICSVIADRRDADGECSYTAYLFREGLDKVLKKVGEAVSLLLLAAKDGISSRIAEEAGGLFYHLFVMMICTDISLDDLADELERRGNRVGNLKTFYNSDLCT